MIFKKITFTNFKSFIGKHEFDFMGGQPGLYFITGENKVEPALGSNGAGKSTLIDVLKWVLNGKTVRNLKAGDVHSRNIGGGTTCTLELNVNGLDYTVFRSWSPNKLTINDEIVPQDTLDKLIGLTDEDLLNTVIYGQFNSSFLDLQPSQMLQVFTGILNLDYWTDKSDLALKERNKLQLDLQSNDTKISYLIGKIEQLEQAVTATMELSCNFDTEKELRLTALETEHARLLAEIEALPEPVEFTASNTITITSSINDIKEVINEIKNDENNVSAKIMVEERALSDARTKLARFQSLGAVCSTCEQPVAGGHKHSEVREAQRTIDGIQGNISNLVRSISEIKAELTEAIQLLRKHESDLDAERIRERNVTSGNAEIAKKTAVLDSRLNSIETDFRSFEVQSNPYEGKLLSHKEAVQESQQILDNLRGAREALAQNISGCDKWVRGFKEIRLLVLEQAITDLEVEVNNAISELGLVGWAVHFDIERENKSGGVTKGFSTFVHSPTNDATVPWAAWSGGEGQRLRLAASAGLSSLILNRRGVQPNVEFYDEPSKHLSEEGLMDLANYLSNRAQTLGKQIWLVDHNIPNFSGISGSIKIVKDENGSRILAED